MNFLAGTLEDYFLSLQRSKATETLGSKGDILKGIPVMKFTGWFKFIFDTVLCNFVIDEFNVTFQVETRGNDAF